jgi:hypothetical protein
VNRLLGNVVRTLSIKPTLGLGGGKTRVPT